MWWKPPSQTVSLVIFSMRLGYLLLTKHISSQLAYDSRHRLNAICPYYTMFPLEFPMSLLRNKPRSLIVLDPFCGRGTTNYAARHLGFRSYGFDTSQVAVAIAKAKLASTTIDSVVELARQYIQKPSTYEVPDGAFWKRAFHAHTLDSVCRIRSRLLIEESGEAAHLLRAVMLGAMHGPLPKNLGNASYFSNQMPRTFASKPKYALKYWHRHDMHPPEINVIEVIRKRAQAALKFTTKSPNSPSAIQKGDATKASTFQVLNESIDLVITSPPYFGMRTYTEDQWLRHWFLGGPDTVQYGGHIQICHSSPAEFAADLARVWDQVALAGSSRLRMVVRFGAIASRKVAAGALLRRSLELSKHNWKITCSRKCGTSTDGKRQASHMISGSAPEQEWDNWISLVG